MPRHAVVLTDSSSESEEEGEGGAELADAEDDAEDDARVHRLRPLVEAYEFAIRNVQLGGDYLAAASAQHARLQSLSAALFGMAVSPRWSPAFTGVLRRARALRLRTLFGDEQKGLLRTGGRCLACGARERGSADALELVAGDADVNACALADLSQRFDALDVRDLAWGRKDWDACYCGTFSGGAKCLDLAAAAVLARNLVLDTCFDLRGHLAEVLNDETVVAQLECDEHAPNPRIEPLTDCTDVARRLAARIRAIEDVLRGKPYPVDPELQRTGTDAVWDGVDACKAKRGDALVFAGARARALVRGDVEPPAPAPPAPAPTRRAAPVASRTRAGVRRAAPIASRTRTRTRQRCG